MKIEAAPLVSVVTASRDRPADLARCIERVQAQTYRPLEHVVVLDGPHGALAEALAEQNLFDSDPEDLGEWVELKIFETGRCWSDELAASPGAVPFQVAQWMASGSLQMWLSDDEEMTPDHIASLVDLLEREHVDFTYSMAETWHVDSPGKTTIIGVYPPRLGEITNCLYRIEVLDYATFEPHAASGTDWHQISRWLAAGASCAMLPRVTFSHRGDKPVGVPDPHPWHAALRGNGDKREYRGGTWNGLPLNEQQRAQHVRVLR